MDKEVSMEPSPPQSVPFLSLIYKLKFSIQLCFWGLFWIQRQTEALGKRQTASMHLMKLPYIKHKLQGFLLQNYDNYFTAAVTKYPNTSNQKKKGFILTYGFLRDSFHNVREGRVAEAGNWLIIFPSTQKVERQYRKQNRLYVLKAQLQGCTSSSKTASFKSSITSPSVGSQGHANGEETTEVY